MIIWFQDEESRKAAEQERLEEEREEEAERKRKEEQERKEHEEYLKLKASFQLEEEGFDEDEEDNSEGQLQAFIQHVKVYHNEMMLKCYPQKSVTTNS